MRFTPYDIPNPARYQRPVTKRRLDAAQRSIDRVDAKYPLLALLDSQEPQETPEERVQKADAGFAAFSRHLRAFEATYWRKGRRALSAHPPDVRRRVLKEWNERKWLPKHAAYFCDFLRSQGILRDDQEEGGVSCT